MLDKKYWLTNTALSLFLLSFLFLLDLSFDRFLVMASAIIFAVWLQDWKTSLTAGLFLVIASLLFIGEPFAGYQKTFLTYGSIYLAVSVFAAFIGPVLNLSKRHGSKGVSAV